MSVQVVLPGVLADLAGGARHLEVDLPTGPAVAGASPVGSTGTLASLLDELQRSYPVLVRRLRDETGAIRRYVNVYIDGVDVRGQAGLASPVGEDAVVRVLPATAGG